VLAELRTPSLLLEVVSRFSRQARPAGSRRAAVAAALAGDIAAVEAALDEEMAREREADRAYWAPLRRELEQLRMLRNRE
jgi:outer membrane receptor for monomeric catechols